MHVNPQMVHMISQVNGLRSQITPRDLKWCLLGPIPCMGALRFVK
jgi:hypothetical protein